MYLNLDKKDFRIDSDQNFTDNRKITHINI